VEGLSAAAAEARPDEPRRVSALLHRDRRQPGQWRPAVRRAHVHHVAQREHVGVPGKRQVGPDRHAARPVDLDPGLAGELSGQA